MEEDLTIPVPSILRLEIDPGDHSELNRLAQAVDQLVSIGTHILKWELEDNSVEGNESAYVCAFFKRALELIDASSLLIQNSSINSVKGIIRVLVELSAQLDYLLDEPSKISEKVLHLAITENFSHLLEANSLLKQSIPSDARIYFTKRVQTLEQEIADPKFDSVRQAFDTKIFDKKKGIRRNKVPKWYSLSKGGENYAELLKTLGRSNDYYLYGLLSDNVHSSKLVADTLYHDENGITRVINIRDYREANQTIQSLVKVSFLIFGIMILRRTKGQKSNVKNVMHQWKLKFEDLLI